MRSYSTRFPLLLLSLVGFSLTIAGCGPRSSPQAGIRVKTLTNGIRVVALPFEGGTNVSIFTFVPMGLAGDEPGRAQWSHLVEHLVIRSTVPAGSMEANAETLPDHMRLDWYGHQGNWHEGLDHHRQWLAGVPFTEAGLEREKPRVLSECDFTARNLATHKFAIAAWAQGVRHGRTHVALKGDVTTARLPDVQAYRNRRFAVLTQTVVCVAGAIRSGEVFSEAETRLQSLVGVTAPAEPVPLKSGELQLTWDLDARHLLMTQPVADDPRTIAVLSVYGRILSMALARDPVLQQATGMALAGADLVTPEGRFFYVSIPLKPGADFKKLRSIVAKKLKNDSTGNARLIRQLAEQMRATLVGGKELSRLQRQIASGADPSMVRMNLALQVGMNEFRYGPRRAAIAAELNRLDPKALNATARKLLSQGAWTVVTLSPGP